MPRWRLEKEFRFEASHQLMFHDGKCARLHGHSWVGRVVVSGTGLESRGPKMGMLLDFGDLKAILQPIVDQLDHHHLNDISGLDTGAPTSEAVAVWVAAQVKAELLLLFPDYRVWLERVRIEETCTSACEYEP